MACTYVCFCDTYKCEDYSFPDCSHTTDKTHRLISKEPTEMRLVHSANGVNYYMEYIAKENKMIKTFIKKPVKVQAVRWTGDNYDEIEMFAGEFYVEQSAEYPTKLIIHTLESDMYASLGDWIIRGTTGEFYPCKPGIFKYIYEEVN